MLQFAALAKAANEGLAVDGYDGFQHSCGHVEQLAERLLPAPEQTMGQLTEAIGRVLEAVVTVDREAFVRRLRESGELEHLRSRFERVRTMANTHAAEIDQWSQRVGQPVRVPRVVFPWPSAAIWDALLAEAVELPQLVWDDGARPPSAEPSRRLEEAP